MFRQYFSTPSSGTGKYSRYERKTFIILKVNGTGSNRD
jgi:hypothetical protein